MEIAPCVSTGREVSFEWSRYRILSADTKVRVTLPYKTPSSSLAVNLGLNNNGKILTGTLLLLCT